MAIDQPNASQSLRHADLSTRSVEELSAEERAELNRRYETFIRHLRAGKLTLTPTSGMTRRIRKWRP